MDIKKINALQVAVRLMDGTAGGYSKDDIYQAKLELMKMILDLENHA